MGIQRVTPRQSLILLASGATLTTLGLFLLFGPWALVCAGAVVVGVALLWPDPPEPTPEEIQEAVRKALGQS